MKKRTITGGVYLVVDPMGASFALPKVKQALEGGVSVIQLWYKKGLDASDDERARQIVELARPFDVPVLIYEQWQLLKSLPLDGVHFDQVPPDLNDIRKQIGRTFLCGITVGNDAERIDWAIENNLNYISFCSLFPSPTDTSCELVRPDAIAKARARTDMAIFVAGGITYDNLGTLIPLGINGVAVVSGIMKADDPKQAASRYDDFFIPNTKIER